jgi:hypothetical protein
VQPPARADDRAFGANRAATGNSAPDLFNRLAGCVALDPEECVKVEDEDENDDEDDNNRRGAKSFRLTQNELSAK